MSAARSVPTYGVRTEQTLKTPYSAKLNFYEVLYRGKLDALYGAKKGLSVDAVFKGCSGGVSRDIELARTLLIARDD